jgi:hypothetical protein
MALSRFRSLSGGIASLFAIAIFLTTPFVMATHDAMHNHSSASEECAVCSFFSAVCNHTAADQSPLPDSGADSGFEIPDDLEPAIDIVADHPTRAPPRV